MQYFGTDGIRQRADYLLSNQIPFLLGKALSQSGAKVIVARDVRTHSKDIEKQLCKGLLEGTAQIWLAGVLPIPALAYTAQTQKADYAVMITASHNAPEFNGLKVFGKNGRKLSKEEELALDDKLCKIRDNPTPPVSLVDVCADALTEDEQLSELHITISQQNHRVRIVDGAEFLYAKHVKSMFPRFDGVKVRIDCAYGCFATLAPAIFLSLGAVVCAEHNVRDGEKVNVDCGSTHIAKFAQRVDKGEIGFAFDGDGDRVIAVVGGKVYDGDAMLLALSTLYRLQGKLKNALSSALFCRTQNFNANLHIKTSRSFAQTSATKTYSTHSTQTVAFWAAKRADILLCSIEPAQATDSSPPSPCSK